MTAAEDFLALHTPGAPLIMPNPWDRGTAMLLASLGFQALATTSQGHAFALPGELRQLIGYAQGEVNLGFFSDPELGGVELGDPSKHLPRSLQAAASEKHGAS